MSQVEAQLNMVSLMRPYRRRKRLGLKGASRKMGHKSTAQFSRWETGASKPDLDNIKKILWVLDAPFEDVFGTYEPEIIKQNADSLSGNKYDE
jgi:hypothetical protein